MPSSEFSFISFILPSPEELILSLQFFSLYLYLDLYLYPFPFQFSLSFPFLFSFSYESAIISLFQTEFGVQKIDKFYLLYGSDYLSESLAFSSRDRLFLENMLFFFFFSFGFGVILEPGPIPFGGDIYFYRYFSCCSCISTCSFPTSTSSYCLLTCPNSSLTSTSSLSFLQIKSLIQGTSVNRPRIFASEFSPSSRFPTHLISVCVYWLYNFGFLGSWMRFTLFMPSTKLWVSFYFFSMCSTYQLSSAKLLLSLIGFLEFKNQTIQSPPTSEIPLASSSSSSSLSGLHRLASLSLPTIFSQSTGICISTLVLLKAIICWAICKASMQYLLKFIRQMSRVSLWGGESRVAWIYEVVFQSRNYRPFIVWLCFGFQVSFLDVIIDWKRRILFFLSYSYRLIFMLDIDQCPSPPTSQSNQRQSKRLTRQNNISIFPISLNTQNPQIPLQPPSFTSPSAPQQFPIPKSKLLHYFNFPSPLPLQYNKTINSQLAFERKMAQAVKVMVRCRPMNQKQKDRGCNSCVEVDGKNNQIFLNKPDTKQQPKSFSFDCVFAPDALQSLIYEQSAFSLVDNVLDGYNGTIFAYGQTGCGKTHTMMGTTTEQGRGIIPRTFSQIITITKSDSTKTHLIRCSFIEIYNEEIHDLLSKDTKAKMDLKESPEKGVYVKDLLQIKVDNTDTMQKYMEIGFSNRATRATNMNAESSRSHSIFTIYIQSQETDEKGNEKFKASKLNLVDLAGSERASKTGATGDGMKQATKINLSLSALGNVISALVDGKIHHIPYRDSKLTRLLQDSLGGNTKTIMIAAVSPADYNYDQTLSTLRYASRAKFIKNKPKINEDPKDAQLREMSEEIKMLRAMLQGKMPMQMNAIAGQPSVTERIVYRTVGQNKENGDTLEQELRNKEQLLKNQQEEKRKMQEKLMSLEKMFQKKEGGAEENKAEMEKIKKLKEKLKLQKKKQEQYRLEKAKRQEQILNIEKNYKNLNEEVDQMRSRFAQIKKKYMANLTQLKDLQNQHEDQKQQLLDTIRYQQKQIKKFSQILAILMSQDQLDTIINNSDWNDEKREWTVPNFVYKERMIALPKLQSSRDLQEEKDKKEIIFKSSQKLGQDKKEDAFKINHIVKIARENYQVSTPTGPPRSNGGLARANLSPVKNQCFQRKKRMDKLEPIQY